MTFSQRYISNILLIAAGAATIFFATYKLTESPAIWYDEGFYTQTAAHIAHYGTQALQIAPDEFVSTEHVTVGFPALYPIGLSYRLFGVGVGQGRAVMAVFICLFVGSAWALVRRMFGATAAAWSVLLMASFAMLYGNGKSVLGEVPGLFFLMLALLALFMLERHRYRGVARYVLAGLAVALCVVTKPIFLLLLGGLFITYALRWKSIPLDWKGAAYGSLAAIGVLALWAYLQFGAGFSLGSVLSFYANPYSLNVRDVLLQNLLRFFTEATPLYTLVTLAVWTGSLWIRRKKDEVSSVEFAAFFFCLLVLAAYLRLPGWYRYLFPALTVQLIFLPPSLVILWAWAREKVSMVGKRSYLVWTPYAVLALLVGMQFYQTAFSSYVADYYSSTATQELTAELRAIGGSKSFFLYNVPQAAVLLPTENYYQYLPVTDSLVIGADALPVLEKGGADFVIAETATYDAHKDVFAQYRLYKTVGKYQILQRNP
jgi:4-amino-4-deoxy-L-arabinose transferase-like glycosyltransferase